LNVGPDATGQIQPEAIAVLRDVAKRLEREPITKKTPKITKVPGTVGNH
jgi:hypothetical protein